MLFDADNKKDEKQYVFVIKLFSFFLFFLLFVSSLDALASSSQNVDEIQQARQAGNNLGGFFLGEYGSKSGAKERIVGPISGSNQLNTLSGENPYGQAKGDVHLVCPHSSEFLTIIFQPSSTGDFKALLTISPNLSPDNKYTIQTPEISGVCTNGFISCTPGTWENCKFYVWAENNGNVSYLPVTGTSALGACFCNNSSCNGSLLSQWFNVVNTFGAGLASFVASRNHFAIAKTTSSMPVVKYFGSDPKDCTVEHGDWKRNDTDFPTKYYGQGENIVNAGNSEIASQMQDETSPAYLTLNNEYMENNPSEFKECEIRNIPTIDTTDLIAGCSDNDNGSACEDKVEFNVSDTTGKQYYDYWGWYSFFSHHYEANEGGYDIEAQTLEVSNGKMRLKAFIDTCGVGEGYNSGCEYWNTWIYSDWIPIDGSGSGKLIPQGEVCGYGGNSEPYCVSYGGVSDFDRYIEVSGEKIRLCSSGGGCGSWIDIKEGGTSTDPHNNRYYTTVSRNGLLALHDTYYSGNKYPTLQLYNRRYHCPLNNLDYPTEFQCNSICVYHSCPEGYMVVNATGADGTQGSVYCAKVTVNRQDTCEKISDNASCKLKDEKICDLQQNCIDVRKNFQQLNPSLQPMCYQTQLGGGALFVFCADGNKITYKHNLNDVAQSLLNGNIYKLCPKYTPDELMQKQTGVLASDNDGLDWWIIKRTYKCDVKKQDIGIDNKREEIVVTSANYNSSNGILTFGDESQEGGGFSAFSGTRQLQYSYKGIDGDCRYTCIVTEKAKRTSVVKGGEETISDNNSVNTTKKSYLPCNQDPNTGEWTCPASDNQTIVQDCVCLDEGYRAISTMAATISAAKDMICSQK